MINHKVKDTLIFLSFFFLLSCLFSAVIYANDSLEELYDKASFLLQSGKYFEGTEVAEKSVRLAEQLYGPKHGEVAYSLIGLAVFYEKQDKFDLAETTINRAKNIVEELYGVNHPAMAEVFIPLSIIYRRAGKFQQAEDAAKKAIDMISSSDPKSLLLPDAIDQLAGLYYARQDFLEATSYYQQSLELREKLLGPNHIKVVLTKGNLASVYGELKQFKEAELLFKEVISFLESKIHNHPALPSLYFEFGRMYIGKGDFHSAERCLKRSLKRHEVLYGKESVKVAFDLANIGWLYVNKGEDKLALPYYAKGLTVLKKIYGPDNPYVIRVQKSFDQIAERQKPSGIYREYYENGTLASEASMKYGIPHGTAKLYYVSGKLRMECEYQDGKLVKPCTGYSESGEIADGVIKAYYKSGQLESEFNYVKGIPEGDFIFYHESGQMKIKGRSEGGAENGIVKYYNELGNLEKEISYQSGVMEGPLKIYNEDGTLADTKECKNWRCI